MRVLIVYVACMYKLCYSTETDTTKNFVLYSNISMEGPKDPLLRTLLPIRRVNLNVECKVYLAASNCLYEHDRWEDS